MYCVSSKQWLSVRGLNIIERLPYALSWCIAVNPKPESASVSLGFHANAISGRNVNYECL